MGIEQLELDVKKHRGEYQDDYRKCYSQIKTMRKQASQGLTIVTDAAWFEVMRDADGKMSQEAIDKKVMVSKQCEELTCLADILESAQATAEKVDGHGIDVHSAAVIVLRAETAERLNMQLPEALRLAILNRVCKELHAIEDYNRLSLVCRMRKPSLLSVEYTQSKWPPTALNPWGCWLIDDEASFFTSYFLNVHPSIVKTATVQSEFT